MHHKHIGGFAALFVVIVFGSLAWAAVRLEGFSVTAIYFIVVGALLCLVIAGGVWIVGHLLRHEPVENWQANGDAPRPPSSSRSIDNEKL